MSSLTAHTAQVDVEAAPTEEGADVAVVVVATERGGVAIRGQSGAAPIADTPRNPKIEDVFITTYSKKPLRTTFYRFVHALDHNNFDNDGFHQSLPCTLPLLPDPPLQRGG